MSYAGLSSFAGVGPWGRNAAETDEVYLWRAQLLDANVRNIQDVQAIAGAIGGGQNLGLDLRGIALASAGSGNTYNVDAAFTTKVPRIFAGDPTLDTAADIATKVHAALAERFPGLQIADPHFDEINDDSPKHPALDFWRFHPVIYEAQFLGSVVPTSAFARFEGLYRGNAEQGASLKKWPKDQPFPKPGNGGNGNGQAGGVSTGEAILWVAGAAAVAWLLFRKPTRKGAAR